MRRKKASARNLESVVWLRLAPVLAANLESFSEFRRRCLWREWLEAASTAKACGVDLVIPQIGAIPPL